MYSAVLFDCYTESLLQKYNLQDNYILFSDFLLCASETRRKLPDAPGVYFVISTSGFPKNGFLHPGSGGFFKGQDPNASEEELKSKWVENANILYIGKAGGVSVNGVISNSTLRKRINSLLRFGKGDNVGHWGGRYLWQNSGSRDYRIYWYDTTLHSENPVILEKELIRDFTNYFGKPPFANL